MPGTRIQVSVRAGRSQYQNPAWGERAASVRETFPTEEAREKRVLGDGKVDENDVVAADCLVQQQASVRRQGMNAWIGKRSPGLLVGEFLGQRKNTWVDLGIVEAFRCMLERLDQPSAKSTAHKQDPPGIRVQEQWEVNALFRGDLVLAGEEQRAVVKERVLAPTFNHGQKSVARGLERQDVLAGEARPLKR